MTAPGFFEIKGRFAGLFRDVFGKRRLVLRTPEEELFLKVPKPLRKELEGALAPGQEIIVTGRDFREERGSLMALQVRVAGREACVSCPIRICTKKNCWRSGGKELWETLEKAIDAQGLSESVTLQAVDCLGHCKHAPNAEYAGREYHRCAPRDAARILAEVSQPTADEQAIYGGTSVFDPTFTQSQLHEHSHR